MTSSKLEVNTGTLRSDLTSIQREINALKREAEDLRNKAALLNRMWEGQAKEEFLSNYAQELDALDAAIDALNRFTAQTLTVDSEYERSERIIGNVVDAVKV